MHSQAGTSGFLISPPRKRATLGRGHLSIHEKQAILNLYKEIIRSDPTIKETRIRVQIANTLGNIHI